MVMEAMRKKVNRNGYIKKSSLGDFFVFLSITPEKDPTESLESPPTADLVFSIIAVKTIALNFVDCAHRLLPDRRVQILKVAEPFLLLLDHIVPIVTKH